jgi:hypothetical protein
VVKDPTDEQATVEVVDEDDETQPPSYLEATINTDEITVEPVLNSEGEPEQESNQTEHTVTIEIRQ